MNKKSLKTNYIFYLSYQILLVFLPLITTPYISRVIGVSGIGAFSYTQSIVNYIIIFGTLGTGMYALRQFAFLQGDRIGQSQLFGEILFIRFILMIPALAVYIFLIYIYVEYRKFFIIQSTFIFAELLNIDWLFGGNEDFKKTVTRSFLTKIVGLCCIFVFIKAEEDIYKYIFILGSTNLFGNIILWANVKIYVEKIIISTKSFKKHLLGSLNLFLPQIASSIYLYCDKIMIGILSQNLAENGYYEQAQKIIKLTLTIITALPAIMLPKISNAFINEDNEKISEYMEKSMEFLFFLGVPLMFGIIATSSNFVPWFFGSGYEKVNVLIKILAPLIILSGMYGIISYQYLIGTKQEKIMTQTVIVGAIVNIVLNIICIPIWQSKGASIASVLAETVVAVLQMIYTRKIVSYKNVFKNSFKCIISGIIMFTCISAINLFLKSGILQTLGLVLIGSIIYFVFLLVFRDKTMMEIKNYICLKIIGYR